MKSQDPTCSDSECGSREYFDAVATEWDAMRSSFYSEAVRDAALRAAAVVPGQVAMDLGLRRHDARSHDPRPRGIVHFLDDGRGRLVARCFDAQDAHEPALAPSVSAAGCQRSETTRCSDSANGAPLGGAFGALAFKLEMLWAMIDTIHNAYLDK